MFHARLTALVAAIAFATPLSAQETTADTVVATVNGLEITVGHMIMARSSLPQQYQQIPDEQLFDNLLNQMIQQAAIASTADGLSKRGEIVVENTRRAQFVEDAIAAELAEALTEDNLRAAYQEAYSDAEPEQEFSAAHILVETEERAAELKTELDNGAEFGDLARAHSTGPSGPNGGDLGWFGRGMMVPEFEEAVLALEPGGISGPVQTQFGWHLVKLNEVREKGAPEIDEVRGELMQQIQRETIQRIIETASDGADIVRSEVEIPASAISDASLLEQ
ncbi:MAG: peptidylprolyl isomerase [Pseudomonadota bacterium]